MEILQPIWLALLIPLGAAMFFWRMPSRLLTALRAAGFVLLLLAVSGISLRLPSRAGTVVVVVDRSHSMPPGGEVELKEVVDATQAAMGPNHQLSVVSFGKRAAVEQPPQAGRFPGFVARVDPDGSNLADALDTALGMIPPDRPGRILVVSDGRWTGRAPWAPASRAASAEVAVDYRRLARPLAGDLAVERIDAPDSATPGEAFMVAVWVRSSVAQEIVLEVLRDGGRFVLGTVSVPAGLSRHVFRDRAEQSGVHEYTVSVRSEAPDPVPENNEARVLVGVEGAKPVLVLSDKPSGLARLLRAGKLDAVGLAPSGAEWGLEDLARYSAVILENVPAAAIGVRGMENLAAWVRDTGGGVMMTGGRNAYAPGGYFKSPLEPVLPVSMELRQEHRKLRLAIVVVMDRSGSMAMTVPGGRTKMDLANLATVEAMNLLSPQDEFGVIAVDSSPHTIVELASVAANRAYEGKIRGIQSMGGGIFVYVALVHAAEMILKAEAGTKHIILFADAQDSERPENYRELLEKLQAAGVTVSVVGLGTPADVDAELLRDIAARGGGRIYFTDDAQDLPRLFAQDTFVVARSTFIDEPTDVRATGGMAALTGEIYDMDRPVGGYNLSYLRPGANMVAVTRDEYKAPLVAAWQAGAGRALAYTGEADGQHTGALAEWPRVGDFMSSLARWAAGEAESLPPSMALAQEVRDGVCSIRLYLDPELDAPPFAGLPEVAVLRGRPNTAPETVKAVMRWDAPDRLRLDVPLDGSETAISTVTIPGFGPVSLSPVRLPYSPEFRPADAGEGRDALERLARSTGGKERIQLAGVWGDLPVRPRLIEIWPWLVFAAMALFLLEVLERRTGLLGLARLPAFAVPRLPKLRLRLRRRIRRKPAVAEEAKATEDAAAAREDAPRTKPASPKRDAAATRDALRKARNRAKRRTGR